LTFAISYLSSFKILYLFIAFNLIEYYQRILACGEKQNCIKRASMKPALTCVDASFELKKGQETEF
jgi:hypothetical protein